MGLVYADFELSNPSKPSLDPLVVTARVDTSAVTLCIPEHIAVQLQLEEVEKREVTTADGSAHVVPYVGPLMIGFGNRHCYSGALVLGESVLMGSAPLDDMDLVLSPSGQTVTVNPESPDMPSAIVKWAAASFPGCPPSPSPF